MLTRTGLALVIFMTCAAHVSAAGPDKQVADFKVHEWGSLIQVQGSDGSRLDGLAENLSELPPFIKRWSSLPQRSVILKRKPILFFYAEKPMHLSVQVRIPSGMPTEWWPPAMISPEPPSTPSQIVEPINGSVYWSSVELSKEKPDGLAPRLVAQDDLYNGLRQTDACWLRVGGIDYYAPRQGNHSMTRFDELERFLLYRGVLQTSEAIALTVENKAGQLSLSNTGRDDLPEVLLVQVGDGGRILTTAVPGQQSTDIPWAEPVADLNKQELAKQGREKLRAMLSAAGLFDKEAKAMLDYWAPEWFAEPGLRAIYLLPRKEIDSLLPLHIHPAPSESVRVLAVCIECLTPEREAQIASHIRGLSDATIADREAASKELATYGQLAESLLMRAKANSEDPDLHERIDALLALLRTPVRHSKP